jgi:putative CocE/NonD family hydrolase
MKTIKITILFIALLHACSFQLLAQNDIQQNYTKEEIQIEMRDGIKLFTSVYAPRDTSISYPILIMRTPFNSEPDKDSYSKTLSYFPHLVKEKYILVFQDVRGKFMSEGEFVEVRPYKPNKKNKETDENSDAYDTIDWLVNNVKNNNGNVGVFGISYVGFYATMTLPNAHPALKAVSPQAPVTDWFLGDDRHHNGAFFLMDSFSRAASMGNPSNSPTRLNSKMSFDSKNKDNYDFFKNIGPIKNLQQKLPVKTNKFWSDLIKHPNYDSFWKTRNVLPHLKNVAPAVLVVGGWFDAEDLYGPLKTYEAIEKQNKTIENRLIMGPWFHGQWVVNEGEKLGNINFESNTSAYFRALELKFFNYYLKNKGGMDLPEASIFITGANEWKSFNAWPPLNIEKKELFLGCDEKLSFSKPATNDCYDEYVVDPNKPVPYAEGIHLKRTREYLTDDQRFASRRPDVMVYQTAILEEDITVVGALNVNLFVSTTGTDADYVVKMIDVFPNELENDQQNDTDITMAGYQMLVRGDVMRGKFRNSFENPEPFTPNKVTEVSFEMPATAHQFKKGHRIMIQVQNSWFPLVDINPQSFVNIYEADENDFIKATHRIYHDAEHASKISISILKE